MLAIPQNDNARGAAVAARRDELLTVQEFAALVRIHPLSVYRRIREGRQPGAVRFGREIRIDLSAATARLYTSV